MSKTIKMKKAFEESENKNVIVAMTFAQAVGFAIQEALSRGLIRSSTADFLVARTDEMHRTLLAGGILTRNAQGIYVETKTKGDKQ